MLRERIIRAWKDPEFRTSLSEEDLAELPENPAGAIELTDDELDMAAGGSWGGQSSRQSSSQSMNSTSQRSSSSTSVDNSSNRSSNSSSNSSSVPAGSGQPTSMNPYTSRYPSQSNSRGYARWSGK